MKNIIFILFLSSMLSCVVENNSNTPINSSKASGTWFLDLTKGQDVVLAKDVTKKNYYFVLDGSGSMGSTGCSGDRTKSIVAKEAVINFVKTIPKENNLGLLVFDGQGTTERISLGINNRPSFVKAVQDSDTESGTPLDTAIRRSLEKIALQAKKQTGYGEYHLVIVTDGEAGMGEDPTDVVNYLVDNTPVVVHALGFCIGEGHSLNQKGRTLYTSASSPEDLSKGLKSVLVESESFDVASFK